MYCGQCGKEIPENVSFCAFCGGSIENKNVNPSDSERVAAQMKSYIGPSIAVFFLYLLFYIPGLIVNYIYRKEARRMEQIAGQKLSGTGCLSVMFWLNLLNIPLLLLALTFLLLYAVGNTIYRQFADSATRKEFFKTIGSVLLVSVAWVGLLESYYSSRGSSQSLGNVFLPLSIAIIAILFLVIGIAKFGFLKAFIISLKKILANFAKSLSNAWQFVYAP